ncbi:DUF6053 domain-containing protein [Lysobacter enzymogenes]|uniref:DUF6053 domain-containing protein n=1 Tax=Lysobacter enzymogenes TaxID=69 RepID=UPI003D18FC3C
MGGPSGPMLSDPMAATWNKSIGPEGPPTKAKALRPEGFPSSEDAEPQRSRTNRKPTSS